MRSRREILTRLGMGAAGCALVCAPGTAQAAFSSHEGSKQAPWWLLEPLCAGELLGGGWVLEGLSPVKAGAAVLAIRHPVQGVLNIHICAHDGAPRGYASTELFDLIVMDGGRGRRTVAPELDAVFSHIADKIRINEFRDAPGTRLEDIQTMLTHPDRVRTFGPPHLQEVR